MEKRSDDTFDFEIVTEGSFKDAGFNISTIIIRLNTIAMNDWITATLTNDRYCYDTEAEWGKYKAGVENRRKAWERKILNKLEFKADEGYSITQSVSEIFTVVLFEKE